MRQNLIDFTSGSMRYRVKHASLKKELLAKALGVKPRDNPVIIDATAGLGRDSFILASLGFKVTMLERSPVLFNLLTDALKRAAQDPVMAPVIARLTLVQADAISWLSSPTFKQAYHPDVIYLDPMFPERQKSASSKKEMVFLQELLGTDKDTEELFKAAFACGTPRIVVKRPRLAESIASWIKPNFSLEGKSSRFDVYIASFPAPSSALRAPSPTRGEGRG
jgi:16S rRNA (guanine1516-N2)-methyltransferase